MSKYHDFIITTSVIMKCASENSRGKIKMGADTPNCRQLGSGNP